MVKLSLFILIPAISWIIVEASLPITFFARPWEGFSFSTGIPRLGDFGYPNTRCLTVTTGDLCLHTNKMVYKKEYWGTDKLGFRNDEFIEDPDILLIGDSFFGGGGLSQEEMLSNRIMAKTNKQIKVYTLAPSSFNTFDHYLKSGIIKKPKLIIYSNVERNLPSPLVRYQPNMVGKIKDALKKMLSLGNVNVWYDRAFRFYSINWFRARLDNQKAIGKPAKGNDDLFFLYGSGQQQHTEGELAYAAKTIESYKQYCHDLGINFLFVEMPNKETVYYDYVPFDKQPDYLLKLDSVLNTKQVNTLNTLGLYNDYRKQHSALLYQLDDTHWNGDATNMVADQIISIVRNKELITKMP